MKNDRHAVLSGRSVLVVEDERLIALDIQDILDGWGCEVIGPVATVTAALALIEERSPEDAILDVLLNGETSEPIADMLRACLPFPRADSISTKSSYGRIEQRPLVEQARRRKEAASRADLALCGRSCGSVERAATSVS